MVFVLVGCGSSGNTHPAVSQGTNGEITAVAPEEGDSAAEECVFFSKDAVKSRVLGCEEVIRTPIVPPILKIIGSDNWAALGGVIAPAGFLKNSQKMFRIIVAFFEIVVYNNCNRTQHASQRCGPRWVF